MVSGRVDELSKDAKARRTAIEKRVSALQRDAQKFVTENVEPHRHLRAARQARREGRQADPQGTAAVTDPGPVKKSTGTTTTAKKAPTKKADKRLRPKTAAK